jgi:S1-C subfamily serine protease
MSHFWRHFISNGLGGRRCNKLGIEGHKVPVDRLLRAHCGASQQEGVEIWRVIPGGPAHQAGLREDDIILSLAAQPAASMDDVHQLLRHHPSGLPLPLVLIRAGQHLERWLVPASSTDRKRKP